MSSEQMISQHTLFPLHEPFITLSRANKCKNAMKGMSYGLPYLSTGYNASRLPKITGLRYCPCCMNRQIEEHGEPYWDRRHQVFGIDTCLEHKTQLKMTNVGYGNRHRHEYFPPFLAYLNLDAITHVSATDAIVAPKITELLNSESLSAPTFGQWTHYYRELLSGSQLAKGKQVRFRELMGRVNDFWPASWLHSCNLATLEPQASWLHGITRKHRKAFSYLEHIVCLSVLCEGDWSIKRVIEDAAQMAINTDQKIFVPNEPAFSGNRKAKSYRAKWSKRVVSIGAKEARKNGAGDVYAWLYRNDKSWLLQINAKHRRPIDNTTNRVDWRHRDRMLVKTLVTIRNDVATNLVVPRQSKQWFINQLKRPSAIEKNKNKLPMAHSFLERYQETVSEYQIRRLTRVLIANHESMPRWRLMRNAGLSEERMTSLTVVFLDEICLMRNNMAFF
jgi:hypothetical protein